MQAEFTSATIVIVGKFEPDAFLPSALADAKVLTQKEAKLSKFRTLVPGTAVQFELSWGELLVANERFQIGTKEAPYVRICDFAIKALQELPTKSVVNAFGINLERHFDLGSSRERDILGRRLAPPTAWGSWGEEIWKSMQGDFKIHGGMKSLQMRKPFGDEKVTGWFDVTVGPSQRLPETGVFFRTNHHHQRPIPDSEDPEDVQRSKELHADPIVLLDALLTGFDDSILLAERIFSETLRMESP